jgi:metal-responsive CopG/Arc/MetJ family transcriptional regulator
LVNLKSMAKRRKRGRPATGRDPVIGVRVPAKLIRKIDRIAEALSVDRSRAVRRLLEKGVVSEAWLLRTGGKGHVGELVAAIAASERATGAEAAVARTKAKQELLGAEIKAHRARLEAVDKLNTIGDRVVLRAANAKKSAPRSRAEPPPTSTYKPEGRARKLSRDEVNAAVERAIASSRR